MMNITKRNYSCWSIGLTTVLVATALLLGGCRSEQTATPEEDRMLLLQMSGANGMRSVDQASQITADLTAEYKDIELTFWTADDKPVEPFRMTFSKAKNPQEMLKLIDGTGLIIPVKGHVGKVSAVCNVAEPAKTNVLDIQRTSEWGEDTEKKNLYVNQMSYVAEKTAVMTTADPNKLTVTLKPKPRMARLEVYGTLALPEQSTLDWFNGKETKANDLRRAMLNITKAGGIQQLYVLSDLRVTGIYANNYIQDINTPDTRTFFGPGVYDLSRNWLADGSNTATLWGAHPVQMHDMFSPDGASSYATSVTDEDKVVGYQIWASKPTIGQEVDHVIIQVRYTINSLLPLENEYSVKSGTTRMAGQLGFRAPKPPAPNAGAAPVSFDHHYVVDRFITIRRFKNSAGASLTHFNPGFVYRIDLSKLNSLFDIWQRDDSGEIKTGTHDTGIDYPLNRRERTDRRPEEDGVEVPVIVTRWSDVQINYGEGNPLY